MKYNIILYSYLYVLFRHSIALAWSHGLYSLLLLLLLLLLLVVVVVVVALSS